MAAIRVDYQGLLETLIEGGVEFIVVGGVCAVLHGAPITTFDLDVVHRRTPENISRLVAALESLDAYYRGQGSRRLRPKAEYLASDGHHLFATRLGPLDVLGVIGKNCGYDELLPDTSALKFDQERSIRVLSLARLIEVKASVGRDKDKAVLPILQSTLDELSKLRPP